MKKILTAIVCLLLMAGCKKAETANSCPTPDIQLINDNNGGINVTVSNGSSYGFVSAEYGPNGFAKGSGTKATLSANGGSIHGLNAGTYDVYVQGNCGGTSNSDWTAAKSILVTGGTPPATCQAPNTIYATVFPYSVQMDWRDPNQYSSTIFELRYDTTGFPISSGHSQTVNRVNCDITSGLPAGRTCDVVIRTKCSDGSWSDWSARFSFVTSATMGSCNAPTNFNRRPITQSASDLSWDNVAGISWQYSLQDVNITPTSYTSTSSSQFTATGLHISRYYLYVRTVCPSGTSAWAVYQFDNV